MENFTPVSALVGGALIGLAGVILMLFNGKIAGISGILGSLVLFEKTGMPWRLAFLAGLVGGAVIYRLAGGEAVPRPTDDLAVLIAGGLLVGFGTRLGTGCTSGHGVCGISRLSARSFAATLVFMVAAMVTVYLTRHVW